MGQAEFMAAYPTLAGRLEVIRWFRLRLCSDGLIRSECGWF